jgi:hypothetical protein
LYGLAAKKLTLRHEEHYFKQKYQPQGGVGASVDICQ